MSKEIKSTSRVWNEHRYHCSKFSSSEEDGGRVLCYQIKISAKIVAVFKILRTNGHRKISNLSGRKQLTTLSLIQLLKYEALDEFQK